MSAQEAERRRISRELHDTVGQELTALSLILKGLLRSARDDDTSATLQRADGMVQRIGQQIHGLAVDLRPTALDDLGLSPAVHAYIEDWTARTRLPVDFHAPDLDAMRIPREIETTAFRLVQEALTNVFKHARAERVGVTLERAGSDLLAIVEDDGRGFSKALSRKGLGIVGMKERASLVNGTVTIETAPGRGTTVVIRIPLAGKDAESRG